MKKIIAIIMTLCMLHSTSSVWAVEYGEELKNMPAHTYTQKFSDVPTSHWAFEYIAELVNDNVLSGYPDGQFRPENNVSRAEFAKIMISASGVKVEPALYSSFSDVYTTDWYCPYIESAKTFLTGYQYDGNAMYLPNKMAIREDIAIALVKLKGYDISVADLGMLQAMFKDYDSISETAKRYVAVAVQRGLVSGYTDGTFKGQQSITRAEAATLIWRANQYGSDNKVLGNNTTPAETDIADNTSVDSTTQPDAETPEKKPSETVQKKPYTIKKLADASVSDIDLMTADNDNNIYYLENGKIYKLNTSSGKKTSVIDVSKLSYEITEEQDVEVEEEVTETVETGEFKTVEEEVNEEVTETVIDAETGEEKEVTKTVTKTVTKEVPITEDVTKTITKTVRQEVVIEEYSDFDAIQITFDNGTGKVYLSGIYRSVKKPYKGSETAKLGAIYQVSNGKATLYTETNLGVYDDTFMYGITVNDSCAVINIDNYEHLLNPKNGDTTKIDYSGTFSALYRKVGNSIYRVPEYSHGGLMKYDTSQGGFHTTIIDYFYYDAVAVKDKYVYSWTDNVFTKLTLSDGSTKELEINTNSENVDFADMGSLNSISKEFFVINDDTMVFYDNSMSAFRLLSKTK